MGRTKSESAADRKMPYAIFRVLVNKEGSYTSEIAEELDKSQGFVSEEIKHLESLDITKRYNVEGSNAKGRQIDWEKLPSLAADLWEINDVKTVEISEKFLKQYIKFYAREKESSTLHRMLVDDLQLGLEIQEEIDELPEDLGDNLEGMLEQRGSVSPHRFVEYALQGDKNNE